MLRFLTRKLAYGLAILIGINLLTFVLFFKVNTPDDMARDMKRQYDHWGPIVKRIGFTAES